MSRYTMSSTHCFPHWFVCLLSVTVMVFGACDRLTTSAPDPSDLMDGPVEGMTSEEIRVFLRGDEAFETAFAPVDGLGPVFNNTACVNCHAGDGRGRPENILIRFDGLGGPQLQDRAIPGAVVETLPAGVPHTLRLPPPVFGVGLIEAIPVATILAYADEFDADGDGISGRPNWVQPAPWVPVTEPGGGLGLGPGPNKEQLGRFSRRSQISSLLQQTAEAYHQDMGITTDFLPEENWNPQVGGAQVAVDRVPDPELDAATVMATVSYIRTLAPPAPGPMTPMRERGKTVFGEAGCASCHVSEMTTGQSPIPALSNLTVAIYSDLLLHDMGDDLADPIPRQEGTATGREWRTTPLWGLRVMSDFLDGGAFLLHDGRAKSVEEAILLHGGEGQTARDAFAALNDDDRAALLDFVESR